MKIQIGDIQIGEIQIWTYMSMKYNSEEYKLENTLRKRQFGKYKTENSNRINTPQKNVIREMELGKKGTVLEIEFGRLKSGTYTSENTNRKNKSGENTKWDILIGEIHI